MYIYNLVHTYTHLMYSLISTTASILDGFRHTHRTQSGGGRGSFLSNTGLFAGIVDDRENEDN